MSQYSINLPPRLPAANAAASVLTAVVPDPPRNLTQLDNGTILKGTVQGRDTDGLLVVSTDKGVLKLSTPANLAPGSQVLLEVRATGDRLQVLVLSVEAGPSGSTGGQAPPRGSGATAPPPSSTTGSTAPPHSPPAAIPVAVVGSLLQGTVVQAPADTLTQLFRSLLPAPPPGAGVLLAQAPLQPGTALPPGATPPLPQAAAPAEGSANLTPAPSPATSPNTATGPAQLGTAEADQIQPRAQPAGTPVQPVLPLPPKTLASSLQAEVQAKIESLFHTTAHTAATGTAGAPAQLPQNLAAALKLLAALPTGTEVKLRLIAISPGPGQPVVLPAAAAGTPHVMAGRIVGYTPTGHAVLHSPLGAIVLQGTLAVPVGTELSFAIEPALPMPAGAAAAAVPTLPQFLLSLSRGWPGLMEALALIRQSAPGGGTDAASSLAHLPQPGPRLAAGLVAAIQALRSGNIEMLLGGLAALRGGSPERDDAIRKLRQEFGQISSLAQDKPGVDWRCCFIPLLDDGTVRQINLFYRRDRGKDQKDDEAGHAGTRFIVEVDMSKMGPFQFDGLVRAKRFDLMVRSHVALTPQMRGDISALFQEALAIGDYTGNLQFQKVREFPVSPLEEIEKSATRVSA